MIISDIINIIIISARNLSGGVAPCSAPLGHRVWPRGQRNTGFQRLGKEKAKGRAWRKGARVRKLFSLWFTGEVRERPPNAHAGASECPVRRTGSLACPIPREVG